MAITTKDEAIAHFLTFILGEVPYWSYSTEKAARDEAEALSILTGKPWSYRKSLRYPDSWIVEAVS